ncbi:hypothetical protein TNCV_4802121 [Trichonephila clavipes]|nr:hypothetical protein TNCV_4802121 [Trichonephila clavipes]
MFEKVIENWKSRLDYIRARRGSLMPEIIFKMLHNAHGIDSVGYRRASGDARRNTSRYRVYKSADGVLRDGSPFPFNYLPKLVVRTRQGQSLQTPSNDIPHVFDW